MKNSSGERESYKRKIISFTIKALDQIRYLIKKREQACIGIRIGVTSGGCSGFKYYIEYADQKNKYDEVIQEQELTILVDPKAMMYLIGTEMDYVTEKFKSGFVFSNPNEKAKCGCGKSFNV